jgi:hypothetical protein
VFDEVNVDEDPALADLRTRDFACACLFLQRDSMNPQEFGGFDQRECPHRWFASAGETLGNCSAQQFATPKVCPLNAITRNALDRARS